MCFFIATVEGILSQSWLIPTTMHINEQKYSHYKTILISRRSSLILVSVLLENKYIEVLAAEPLY